MRGKNGGCDGMRRLWPHLPRALRTPRIDHPRQQLLQVIVDLGDRPDRGARGLDGIRLLDRNGRWDSPDRVHLRLVHSLEKLSRIRAERLYVPALPLGV